MPTFLRKAQASAPSRHHATDAWAPRFCRRESLQSLHPQIQMAVRQSPPPPQASLRGTVPTELVAALQPR